MNQVEVRKLEPVTLQILLRNVASNKAMSNWYYKAGLNIFCQIYMLLSVFTTEHAVLTCAHEKHSSASSCAS
jgi:hypothetical protein